MMLPLEGLFHSELAGSAHRFGGGILLSAEVAELQSLVVDRGHHLLHPCGFVHFASG